MEKEPIKIKLSTAILVFLLIALMLVTGYLIFKNNELKNETKNTAEAQNVLNLNVEDKKTTGLTKLEENDELKNFISYVGFLNEYNDNEYRDENLNKDEVLTNDKIMIASMFTKLEVKNDYVTYNPKEIKEAIKEIFNEDIDVEEFIKLKKGTIFYDSKIGAYIDGGGDATYSVYFIKIESQNNSDGVYEISFIYSYVGEGDLFEDDLLEDIDCYKTTIKIRVNDNYKYSKYQLVSSDLSGKKVGKIKDIVDLNETKNKNHNVSNETSNTSSKNNTKTTDKYKEITKGLDGIDVLYVTEVEKSNGEYTLKGVIYSEYTISKSELDSIVSKGKMTLDGKEYTLKKHKDEEGEHSDSIYELSDGYTYINKTENPNTYVLFRCTELSYVWKLTNDYRKIKVSEDLIVEDDYTENKTTVKKEFDNLKNSIKAEEETNPTPAYRFVFKNGKCSKIIRAITTGL